MGNKNTPGTSQEGDQDQSPPPAGPERSSNSDAPAARRFQPQPKAKRSFQVITGTHHEGDVAYGEGEVVESDRPLDVLFINKFKALDVDPSDRPPRKVVVDGGRTGATSVPVDESATTRSAGGHQAWDDEGPAHDAANPEAPTVGGPGADEGTEATVRGPKAAQKGGSPRRSTNANA